MRNSPHLAMTSDVLYCTPSTNGTGASRKTIMEAGVTGMSSDCQAKGRSSGSRPSTQADSTLMWGQKNTSCRSSSAAVRMSSRLSSDRDLGA